MNRFFAVKRGWTLAVYCFLDLLCAGMGMGVPIFSILFGFVVGWYAARRVVLASTALQDILKRVLVYAAIASGFTFLIMAVVWVPTLAMLFDLTSDASRSVRIANFGIPMILYEPRASFIGWIVLMIATSPFLQFLMTLLAPHTPPYSPCPTLDQEIVFRYNRHSWAVRQPFIQDSAARVSGAIGGIAGAMHREAIYR